MDFNQFMESFSEEINGKFAAYDNERSVVIVPIDGGRYQAVVGQLGENKSFDKTCVEFYSKVCEWHEGIALQELVFDHKDLVYAKFILDEEFIKVKACVFLENTHEELMKDIIIEVATLADTWELKLTGADVY